MAKLYIGVKTKDTICSAFSNQFEGNGTYQDRGDRIPLVQAVSEPVFFLGGVFLALFHLFEQILI